MPCRGAALQNNIGFAKIERLRNGISGSYIRQVIFRWRGNSKRDHAAILLIAQEFRRAGRTFRMDFNCQ